MTSNAYLRLAKACVNGGDAEAGAAVLKNAMALAPDRIEGYASLAQLYLGDKQPIKRSSMPKKPWPGNPVARATSS